MFLLITYVFSASYEELMKKMGVDFDEIGATIEKYTSEYGKEDGLKMFMSDSMERCDKNNLFPDCLMAGFPLDINGSKRYNAKYYNKVVKILKNKCDDNDSADDCFLFAMMVDDKPINKNYDFGREVKDKDAEIKSLVFKYVSKSCDLGNMLACDNKIYLMENKVLAERIMHDYCFDKNIASYCFDLGLHYENGYSGYLGKGIKDINKTIKYYRKLAQIDKKYLATLASVLIKDLQCKEGMELARSTCSNKDAYGCILVASSYEKGECARYNPKGAKEFFGLACDYGEQVGCVRYKELTQTGF